MDKLEALKNSLGEVIDERFNAPDFDPRISVMLEQGNIADVVLRADPDALIYLAGKCLELAASNKPWDHHTIDAGNIGELGSGAITIAKFDN